jgi:hypothetical protein
MNDPATTNDVAPSWTGRVATIIAPAQRDGISCERVGDEHLLTDPVHGTTVFLNETAALVWAGCDGRTATHAIADQLVARYDVPADRALDDVEELLEGFAAAGLLQLDEGAE